MTSVPFPWWPVAFRTLLDVGAVGVTVWTLYTYVVVLSQGSRRGVLALNKAERRFAGAQATSARDSHRAWIRFREKHLATARGVQRAQQRLFRPASWLGVLILIDVWGLVGLIAAAAMTGHAPRSWDGVAFALAFLSAVPWLTTALLQRVFWHWRARSEWEVVLLGERLVTDADADLDQDFIGRRTERVLAALGRRFPRGSLRRSDTAEGRHWLRKTQPAVEMRAQLVTTDLSERRGWSAWIATWLDRVSESFAPGPVGGTSSGVLPVRLPSRDPDVLGFGALVGTCVGFGAVGCALAAGSSGVDLSTAFDAWDSAVGRLATLLGIVGTLLGLLSYRRG